MCSKRTTSNTLHLCFLTLTFFLIILTNLPAFSGLSPFPVVLHTTIRPCFPPPSGPSGASPISGRTVFFQESRWVQTTEVKGVLGREGVRVEVRVLAMVSALPVAEPYRTNRCLGIVRECGVGVWGGGRWVKEGVG